MSWRWKVGRVFGIDLYIHLTFFLLLGWVLMGGLSAEGGWAEAVGETFLVVLVFATVVLHELGHALAARRYGIGTRDITLLPIGGVARLERMPRKPVQELVVALAGPAVNVVIAAILGAYLLLAEGIDLLPVPALVPRLFAVNVGLIVFNLLPAFPMDGGRVLRALLGMRLSYAQATRIAAGIGQGMAVLFGLVGLMYNPMLILVALFVWAGAAQEARMVGMESALDGIAVDQVMIRDFRTLASGDSLGQAWLAAHDSFQRDFPVLDEGRLVGVLTAPALHAGLSWLGQYAAVGEVMQRSFPTASVEEPLEAALARLQGAAVSFLPVLSQGQLVGMLTPQRVQEFLYARAWRGRSVRTSPLTPPRPSAAPLGPS